MPISHRAHGPEAASYGPSITAVPVSGAGPGLHNTKPSFLSGSPIGVPRVPALLRSPLPFSLGDPSSLSPGFPSEYYEYYSSYFPQYSRALLHGEGTDV